LFRKAKFSQKRAGQPIEIESPLNRTATANRPDLTDPSQVHYGFKFLFSSSSFNLHAIEIKVRQAELSDAAVIAQFNQQLAKETEDLNLEPACIRAGVAALLSDPSKGIYFVAEVEGEVVGQLMITYEWSDWRNGNIWWLQSVYVKEQFRRAGVFRALFDFLRDLAASQTDVRGLRLYMHADNIGARQAYERMGMNLTKYEVFELALPGRDGVE
jgi:GNAT superfamily N-acetyltransferase